MNSTIPFLAVLLGAVALPVSGLAQQGSWRHAVDAYAHEPAAAQPTWGSPVPTYSHGGTFYQHHAHPLAAYQAQPGHPAQPLHHPAHHARALGDRRPGAPAAVPTPPADSLWCDTGCFRPAWDMWIDLEYLMWWNKGRRLPPLVTTSVEQVPLAEAGVLGEPATRVIFGDERIGNDRFRSGGRLNVGRWLDQHASLGVGGRFWALQEDDVRFFRHSDQTPILARPFTATPAPNVDIPAALIVAFPGNREGFVNVESTMDFLGAEAYGRALLTQGSCYDVDVIGGYHFTRLDDHLRIHNRSELLVGTELEVTDLFRTRNEFHGGSLGLQSTWHRDGFRMTSLAKVSLGNMRQTVDIDGVTVIDGVVTEQGLLARDSNIGRHSRNQLVWIPEVNLSVGYALTDHIDLTVGYSLIYWTRAALAGDHVDLRVNLSPFPDDPPFPAFAFNDTDFWLLGLNFGLSADF